MNVWNALPADRVDFSCLNRLYGRLIYQCFYYVIRLRFISGLSVLLVAL